MSKIIVPTDFTPVSHIAIRYACEVGKATGSEIHLLHIVKSRNEVDEANRKMAEQAASFNKEFNCQLQTIARVGNTFGDIPDVAEEEKAELMVMGTHGLRGMQFIVGSAFAAHCF